MINENLLRRANYIFDDLGGYDFASKHFTDNEITDICLFNGLTLVLFPSCKGEISYINMGDIDYKVDTEFYIVDKAFKSLYRSTASRYKNDYYLGLSDEHKTFLSSLSERELYYLIFISNNGPSLAQLLVSQRLPTYEINQMLKDKEDEKDKQKIKESQILLDCRDFPGLYTYSSNTLSNEYDLVYGYSEVAEVLEPQILITFDRDTYITFRFYSDFSSGLSLTGDKETLEEILTLDGYTNVYTDNEEYIYVKELATDIYAELTIDYIDNVVDIVKEKQYRVLRMDSVKGYNANKVFFKDNVYSLLYKPSYLTNKGVTFNSANRIYEIGAKLI